MNLVLHPGKLENNYRLILLGFVMLWLHINIICGSGEFKSLDGYFGSCLDSGDRINMVTYQ